MFETLQQRLASVFDKLTGRGALSEQDVAAALREIRRALIEADVALDVVRSFTEKVREKAVGAAVIKSVKPGQMVVKIVHDELVAMLGEEGVAIDLQAPAPVVIMMVGLQGSGKTTTSAKIAKRLSEKQGKKLLLASLDTQRPAAQEQLRQLGEQTGIATLPIVAGQSPVEIAARAAFREGAQKAGAQLLEPIMKVEVVTPEDYVGDVIGDLNSRRGQISGTEARGIATVVNAFVPLANMFGYVNSLRSMSQGRAQYTMQFDHYEPVPTAVAQEIQKKYA